MLRIAIGDIFIWYIKMKNLTEGPIFPTVSAG